jgi:phenylacetate-CoA ligase
MDDGYRRIGASVVPGGIGDPERHLETMRWAGVTALFAFPTFLDDLTKTAEKLGIEPRRDLKVRHCAIAGEMHSEDLRARMEDWWGMQVRELYGGAEVPFSAAECEHGTGMHLNPDMVVEILHPETKEPVEPGEPGVIVVSETKRRAYPAIRYWTGDLTAGLDHDPCPCGRTTPRLGRILGRVGDIPRVKGLFVVPKEVQASLAGFPDLGAFQLVVDRPDTRDRLRIRIEHHGDTVERDALIPQIVSALKQGTRLTAEVILEDPDTLAGGPVVDDQRRL